MTRIKKKTFSKYKVDGINRTKDLLNAYDMRKLSANEKKVLASQINCTLYHTFSERFTIVLSRVI